MIIRLDLRPDADGLSGSHVTRAHACARDALIRQCVRIRSQPRRHLSSRGLVCAIPIATLGPFQRFKNTAGISPAWSIFVANRKNGFLLLLALAAGT